MDKEHEAEIWLIKPHLNKNKISLKIVTVMFS